MFLLLLALASCLLRVVAFDNSRYDNVAVYWGQNSYGAVHGDDPANFQKTLSFYCQDNAIDVFPIAFVNVFFGAGGLPSMNLANVRYNALVPLTIRLNSLPTCNAVDNSTFPNSNLPDCSALASDIKLCQSKGKLVTLSLGGATGSVGFQSDAQGETFAQTIWNLFLGGSSSTRPFGSAVLDGVDLDIEGGTSLGYAAFVNKIRSLASGSSKKYYITAAPQCVYPDAALSGVLNSASFDAVYVQFYNNPCGLQNFAQASNWNFGIWDIWARTISINKNVKVYIGSPASSGAAGGGYVGSSLTSIAVQMRKSFPSFGGVMLWDASQAYWNSRYDSLIKNALTAAGGTGFTFPACTTAYSSGSVYTAGQRAAYNGYIWEAKWWTQSTPAGNPNGDWSAVSACSGSGTGTTTSPTTSPTGGKCNGVAAWSSTAVYTTGNTATYSGSLWTANWWTQGDTPGGSSGAWTNSGSCTAKAAAKSASAATHAATSTEAVAKNSRFFRF